MWQLNKQAIAYEKNKLGTMMRSKSIPTFAKETQSKIYQQDVEAIDKQITRLEAIKSKKSCLAA